MYRRITSLHQRSGLFVWVLQRRMCVVSARVWHLWVLVCVCVYKIKMKCKEKNGTFHVNYPPAIICCSYVLVCYSYVLACYLYVLVY